jgi:hypothetical protein
LVYILSGVTKLIKICVVVLLFVLIFYGSNFQATNFKSQFSSNFSIQALAFVTIIFICNFYIVAARLYLSYKQFKLNISYSAARQALIAGYVGGIVPVFGAALGQSLELRNSSAVSTTSSSFIFFYERIVMAATGLVLSFFAMHFLFGKTYVLSLLQDNVYLVEYFIVILCAIGVVFWKGLIPSDKKRIRNFLTARNIAYVLGGVSLSICSWLLAASSFLACVYIAAKNQNLAEINSLQIFCASIMVSFLASMPFSVSGWGIREFAAVTIFSLISIPKDIALFSSISVGIFSLISILLVGGFYYFQKPRSNAKHESLRLTPKKPLKSDGRQYKLSNLFDKKLIYIMGCLVAFFIFFQAHLTLGTLKININIADAFAICGFIVLLVKNYNNNLMANKLPNLRLFIYGAVASFLSALIIGFLNTGFSGYAFFSKFFGFLVLLGYSAIGAMFIDLVGKKGITVSLQLMQAVLLAIIAWQLFLNFLVHLNLVPITLVRYFFDGCAGNRNAFAMQILCVLCMQLAIMNKSGRHFYDKSHWVLSFLVAALIFTFSRAAMGAIGGLFVILILLKNISFNTLKTVFLQTIIIAAGIFALEYLADSLIILGVNLGLTEGTLIASSKYTSMFGQHFSSDASDAGRWYSIIQGLKMWLQQPFFGIGLGSFMNAELLRSGVPLIIHSSYIWILCEFGIVGSIAFLWYGSVILKRLYLLIPKLRLNSADVQDKIFFNLILVFGAMALLHEVLYQRLFWFILGMSTVYYLKPKPTINTNSLCYD